MPSDPRTLVRNALTRQMADYIWSSRYDKVLPLTFNGFALSAILPTVFYMFRFGQRRGKGQFVDTFSGSDQDNRSKRRKIVTVDEVAAKLAASPALDGFDNEVTRAILGDLLLCTCLENVRHALGRDIQVQRVLPVHYMSSWIDLPDRVAHLRFVPEMIVALLADQDGDFVKPTTDSERTRFAVATGHDTNRLLSAFSHGVRREGNLASRKSDKFDEAEENIGIDQLVMVRLAQLIGAAPGKAMRRDGEKISNQRPIAQTAARHFGEDMRKFIRAYSLAVPRQTFVELIEASVSVGMTTVLTSVLEILSHWADCGTVPHARQQHPTALVVDCSNGIDADLRRLSERTMDDLMRRLERIPTILMMLRILDYMAERNPRLRDRRRYSTPDATEWIALLGSLRNRQHQESDFIHRTLELQASALAEELDDDYSEVSKLLRAERQCPDVVQRLSGGLISLMGQNVRGDLFKLVDSALNVERPHGLAKKRRIRRSNQLRGVLTQSRDARSLVLTDAVLDYLVHLHVTGHGDLPEQRLLSVGQFLHRLRERYGFFIDVSPPHSEVSNELLQRNRSVLERRLRDLGLLTGVNDAESMKHLHPRFEVLGEVTGHG